MSSCFFINKKIERNDFSLAQGKHWLTVDVGGWKEEKLSQRYNTVFFLSHLEELGRKHTPVGQAVWQWARGAERWESVCPETKKGPKWGLQPAHVRPLARADRCGDETPRASDRPSADCPSLTVPVWRGVLLNVWSSSIGKYHKSGGN